MVVFALVDILVEALDIELVFSVESGVFLVLDFDVAHVFELVIEVVGGVIIALLVAVVIGEARAALGGWF